MPTPTALETACKKLHFKPRHARHAAFERLAKSWLRAHVDELTDHSKDDEDLKLEDPTLDSITKDAIANVTLSFLAQYASRDAHHSLQYGC